MTVARSAPRDNLSTVPWCSLHAVRFGSDRPEIAADTGLDLRRPRRKWDFAGKQKLKGNTAIWKWFQIIVAAFIEKEISKMVKGQNKPRHQH